MTVTISGELPRSIEEPKCFGEYAKHVLGKVMLRVIAVSVHDILLDFDDVSIILHGGTEQYEDYEIVWDGHHLVI